MNKIKSAVIGLGRIASLLEDDTLREKPCTHTGAITANPDCELVSGCDINDERRRLFSEKWQVPVYSDAKEMLRIHKPQLVSIATHPDSHYYYCCLAKETGVPVIICEKPLADNIRDARKITKLAKDGTIILTNHERRYSQDYIRIKNILEEERFGKLLSIRAILYMGKSKRLVDVFWHDGTHLADIIMFLAGGILKHKRRWGAKLTSKEGTAWLEGQVNKIPVVIEVGAKRDHLVFEMEFSCEKGRLRIGNGIYEVQESAPSPYAENFRSLKNTGENFTDPTGYFANMIKDAVACVKDPGHQPVSGAIDGLRVIEYLNSVSSWR
ncbi:MAG: Gfo/Idh/MocA family oxidoreductase [Treponema sp.]|jgi:predicted dehydrogenase|nr:Gfo/Idh/MocA family oxidoreductase [Treponema sp.]